MKAVFSIVGVSFFMFALVFYGWVLLSGGQEPEPLLSRGVDPQPQGYAANEIDWLSTTDIATGFEGLSVASKNAQQGERYVFDCDIQDCFYAAIDKSNGLPADYTPALSEVDGKLMQAGAATLMQQMLTDMRARGIDAFISSAYRSYDTQAQVLANRIELVKSQSPGIPDEDAIVEANTFSAKPGHSEHQLGTTADLNTRGARFFDQQQNSELYTYIEDNAHRYGYVVTYPKNQQELTGYIHEPWHVRYIGIELATKMDKTGYIDGNGIYTAQFLRDEGLSL